jgi:hypothetical protein
MPPLFSITSNNMARTLKQICTLAMWSRFQDGENMALAKRSTVRFCVSSLPR